MIRGVHAMLYTPEPDAARAFLRDVMGLVAHDVGEGWLIFDVPEAEVGCHDAKKPSHGISFYCDDVDATLATLRSRGARVVKEVEDRGWGRVAVIAIPGGVEVEVYEPRYTKG